jgi:hypothetical protein
MIASFEDDNIEFSVTGGFGFSVVVRNTGTIAVTNLPWSIDVTGGIILLSGGHMDGVITELAAGETAVIQSSHLWGFGSVKIIIHVGDTTKSAVGFLFGPLVVRLTI